jgi:hypothetical protein
MNLTALIRALGFVAVLSTLGLAAGCDDGAGYEEGPVEETGEVFEEGAQETEEVFEEGVEESEEVIE